MLYYSLIEDQENVFPMSQEKLRQDSNNLQIDRENNMIGNPEGLRLLKPVQELEKSHSARRCTLEYTTRV